MFDFALSKMAMIGVVSLVVLGPERLPRVARTSGALLGRAQRYIHSVREEVSREIELAEIRQAVKEVESSARLLETSLHDGMHKVESLAHAATTPESMTPTAALPAPDANVHTAPPFVRADEIIAQMQARRRRLRSRQVTLPKWYKRASTRRGKLASGAARRQATLSDMRAGEPA
ncbi:Sec-independent protein translocase subunit TatB [Paraburkholderia sp. Ac-20340]|uniref:twin-arginine translocase TatA/TatE family subunit n=1 Tax=Paraburkholderia sp. Ac-20340 TaxID=2703888 RepID=UPI001981CBA5|nr:twin-arginine translocase TatA/TatE family subunit [Paraburkholderia sp. Ac-20340]MBN3855023.1 Sec-independent protein translocase subunit TatB [Paraburkholderia sp. Ac-20340]